MNKIKRYVPTFFEVASLAEVAFETVDELKRIDFVARFVALPSFYRLSLSEHRLMAELDGGAEWWVVGFYAGPPIVLPEWPGPPRPG